MTVDVLGLVVFCSAAVLISDLNLFSELRIVMNDNKCGSEAVFCELVDIIIINNPVNFL